MFDFHEKRKIRSWLYSRVSIAIILMVTLWLSTGVFERYQVEREMAAKREEKEAELKDLEARANVLNERVEHLLDDRGIEEELRSRFDVAKEGEQVVVIVEDESASNSSMNQGEFSSNEEEEDTGWSLWDMLPFW